MATKNPFDQFDPPATPKKANVFDAFDGQTKPSSAAAYLADTVVAAGQGVTSGVQSLTNVAGADNKVSRALGNTTSAMERLQTPYRQAEKANRQRLINEAEQSGSLLKEIGANLGAFAEAPIDTTVNALGSAAPTLAAAVLTGGASVPAQIAARVLPVVAGAAQGVGAVKGSIYEAVADKPLPGETPEQTDARAAAAQSYDGPNTGQIMLGGGLGGFSGGTGIESAAARLMGRRAAAQAAAPATVKEVAKAAGMGALKEAPLEGLQGGQERVAGNIALQNEGFDTPTFEGAIGQGALEAVAGGALGGGFGAVERLANTPPPAAPPAAPGTPPAPAAPLPAPPAPFTNPPSLTGTSAADMLAGQAGGLMGRPDPLRAVVKPSEAMGIDPSAGPLSRVAAAAVDSGVTDQAVMDEARAAAIQNEEADPAKRAEAAATDPDAPLVAAIAAYNEDMQGMASPSMVSSRFGVTVQRAAELMAKAEALGSTPSADELFPPPAETAAPAEAPAQAPADVPAEPTTNEQDRAPEARAEAPAPSAAPVEAPAPAGGNDTPAAGVPDARGTGDAQADGVTGQVEPPAPAAAEQPAAPAPVPAAPAPAPATATDQPEAQAQPQNAAPPAPAPQTEAKSAITKAELDRLTVPEMTEDQLRAGLTLYGAVTRRANSIRKEIQKRGLDARSPAPQPQEQRNEAQQKTDARPDEPNEARQEAGEEGVLTNGAQTPEAQQATSEGRAQTPALLSDQVSDQAPAADASAPESRPDAQEVGPFGPILRQFRGDAQGAIQALTAMQTGEAVAALNHSEVGDIDLVWGEPGTGKKDGFGLSKLVKFHPEVLGDLQGFLSTLKKDPRRSGENRIRLVSEGGEAAVSLDWKGDRKVWLLTAYEKGAGDGTTMNTADVANRDDTTRPDASAELSVPAPARDGNDALSEREKAAKAKMFNALGKLAALASKNTRMNWTPEEEQQLLPIVIELFDGAMELGAVKFKQAVAYVREFIANGIDQETADAIPFETLQGAYIAVAGRHKDKLVTPKREVAGFESLDELNAQEDNEAPAQPQASTAPTSAQPENQDDPAGNGADDAEPLDPELPQGNPGLAQDLAPEASASVRGTDADGNGRPGRWRDSLRTGVGRGKKPVLSGSPAEVRPVGRNPVGPAPDATNQLFGEAPSNYEITDADAIGEGTAGQKLRANMEAIHDYNTPEQKAKLFAEVNDGTIRVLMGSSAKMGAGTNAQKRLVALHHMDAPWRPSDVEQREGRIIRQGNGLYGAIHDYGLKDVPADLLAKAAQLKRENPNGFEVEITAYSTAGTSDAVMWQVLERKARAIEEFRSAGMDATDEEGSDSNQYAEFMAQSTGNPVFRLKLEAEREVDLLDTDSRGALLAKGQAKRFLETYEDELRDVRSAIDYAQAANVDQVKVGREGGTADEFTLVMEAARQKHEKAYGEYLTKKEAADAELAAWNQLTELERGEKPKMPVAPSMPGVLSKPIQEGSGYARAIKAALENATARGEGSPYEFTMGNMRLRVRKSTVTEDQWALEGWNGYRFETVTWGDGKTAESSSRLANALMPGNLRDLAGQILREAQRYEKSLTSQYEVKKKLAEKVIDTAKLTEARKVMEWYRTQVAFAEQQADIRRGERPNRYIQNDRKRELTQAKVELGDTSPIEFEGEVFRPTGFRDGYMLQATGKDGREVLLSTKLDKSGVRSVEQVIEKPKGVEFSGLMQAAPARPDADGADMVFSVVGSGVDGAVGPADTEVYGPATQEHRDRVARVRDSANERLRQGGGRPVVLDAVTPGDTPRGRTARSVAKIAQALFGREVIFVKFQGEPLFNGMVSGAHPGKVFLNIDSPTPLMAVLGHELLHHMARTNPGLYRNLSQRLARVMTGANVYADVMRLKYRQLGIDPSNVDFVEELEADIVGDNFMDPEFWKMVSDGQPGLFRRIADVILRWLDFVTQQLGAQRPFNTDRFLSDIAAARAAVADAMRQFSASEVGSLAEPGGEQMSVAMGQTETPAFRRWFGDSKVVDEQGRPLVVYHGTDFPRAIEAFKMRQEKAGVRAAYFTPDPAVASAYATRMGTTDYNTAPNVLPVYLALKNPLEVDGEGRGWGFVNDRALEAAKKGKHDGIIIRNVIDAASRETAYPSTVYIAFRPEQIKSATGNRGTFDPANPDIRFSIADVTAAARNAALPAGYIVNDFLKTSGKVSFWSKTVGTMYDLARRQPLFRPVFESAQKFLSDVSFYASEAANLAPSILPKLETLRDITKAPLAAADSKAIARPIFEGTLIWTRGADGKPMPLADLEASAAKLTPEQKAQELMRKRMLDPKINLLWKGLPVDQYNANVESRYASQVLKGGIVFKPEELKSLFGLNDKQVKLYEEFRKATDTLGIKESGARKRKKRRLPFDATDLHAIFGSEVFTRHTRSRGQSGEASYWIPVLMYYTGARPEELAGLALSDLVHDDKLGWSLRIVDRPCDDDVDLFEDGEVPASHCRTLKNAVSIRRVPVTKELIDLGLLRYVEWLRDRKATVFFPTLKKDFHGKLSGSFSKFFGRYKRSLGITDKRKVLYSFRHCMKDMLEEAGVPTKYLQRVLGHTTGDGIVTDGYGSDLPFNRLVKHFSNVRFPAIPARPWEPGRGTVSLKGED